MACSAPSLHVYHIVERMTKNMEEKKREKSVAMFCYDFISLLMFEFRFACVKYTFI